MSENEGTLFGYYPDVLEIEAGDVKVSTLPGLEAKRERVAASGCVANDWYYSSLAAVHPPSLGRLFTLPNTHRLEHRSSVDREHHQFLLWCLGFIHGMRFSAVDNGFIDATPLRTGTLVDFVALGRHLNAAIVAVDKFWVEHQGGEPLPRAIGAAIHALFLSQRHEVLLSYEQFIYAYTALDTCWWVYERTPVGRHRIAAHRAAHSRGFRHAERIREMCDRFGMPCPRWVANGSGSAITLRNETLHEALFLGAPLGFKTAAGSREHRRLIPGMRDLASRLIVALLGIDSPYIRSSTESNMPQSLTVCE